MEGFSYNNIFETKGIEYLIIIAFLLIIIPFWILINRESPVKSRIRNAIGILSENILRIPFGLFFSKNHTWAHLEKSGLAQVGIDDFILHITGELKLLEMRDPGSSIKKGDLLAVLGHNGKMLQVYSPISGKITHANSVLPGNPSAVNEDPYGKGWMYKIDPSQWAEETSCCMVAGEALAWTRLELQRFRDFLAGSLRKYSGDSRLVMLQDGGELYDRPLSDLPAEIWFDFQKSFLELPG